MPKIADAGSRRAAFKEPGAEKIDFLSAEKKIFFEEGPVCKLIASPKQEAKHAEKRALQTGCKAVYNRG